MRVTMVKKVLSGGEPCRKCAQAEQLLKTRDLWKHVDEVVTAVEADPQSEGMLLAARHGIDTAPFFIVTDDSGAERIFKSALLLVRELTAASTSAPAPAQAAFDFEGISRVATDLAKRHPRDILEWGLRRFGKDCAIAFSGAEDVALIHMASELGLPFSVFSLDTGRLHPETYRFMEKVRTRYGVELEVQSPDSKALEALVREKGLFSFYEDGHHECCGVRKVEPLRRALLRYEAWVTGQRMDQSPATRGDIAVVERDSTFSGRSGALLKLNPLTHWTSSMTWAFIREHGVPFNALHERGYVSIGCEPCTRAVLPGEHERAGRWWWEEATQRECGLHAGNVSRNE